MQIPAILNNICPYSLPELFDSVAFYDGIPAHRQRSDIVIMDPALQAAIPWRRLPEFQYCQLHQA